MKKLIALVLCVLMLGMMVVPATAAADTTVTVTASKTAVKRGETITVTVAISGTETFSSFGYMPVLNSDVFEITKARPSEAAVAATAYDYDTETSGIVACSKADAAALMPREPGAMNADLFIYTIKIKDDAPIGTVYFTSQDGVVIKSSGKNVAFDLVETAITVVCDHSYGDWTNKDAANHEQVCSSCGDKQTAAHTWDAGKVTTEPTCKDPGVKTYTCTVCGGTKTEPVPVTDNHTYGKWTNKDAANHEKVCTVCGKAVPEAHKWDKGEISLAPTCKDPGVKTYTCTVCGGTKTEPVPVTDNHTYGDWTNKNANEHEKACTVCGKTESAKHAWDEGKTTTEPDCKNPGVKTYTCTDCGATKTEPIPSTGNHGYGKWVKISDTKHERTCSGCGEKQEATHVWDEGKITTEPTCKDTGVKTFTCADCGATRTETVPVIDEHTYGDWTKADEEKHEKTCKVCGKKESANHAWDDGKVTTEPTCAKEGEKTFTCADCGATKTEAVPTVPHKNDVFTQVDELTHNVECSVCGKKEAANHVFDKAAFDADNHWTECVCGAKKDVAAHVYDQEKWTSDENNHWHACTCGAAAESAAHTWDEGKVTVEATTTKEGEKTFTCTVCGATKTEKINKLPTTPVTGDNGIIIPVVALMVLSALGLGLAVLGRKRTAR